MSIQTRRNKEGQPTYVVRWREDGKQRARSFTTMRDARTWEAEVIRRKRLGTLHVLDAGQQTLDAFVAERWAPDRAADLAPATRRTYAGFYKNHIAPEFGSVALRDITPSRIAQWRAARERAGAGPKALREAHTLLGGILGYAVELEEVQSNAARAVRRRKRSRPRRAEALTVAQVEAIRVAMAPPWAMLVAVLAYTGMRPGEALHLRWRDVGPDTVHVGGSLDLTTGTAKATKTEAVRDVDLIAPLAQDLAEWRLRSGRPGDREPVLPHPARVPWTKSGWDNFRRREWNDALTAAGVEREDGRSIVPYDLRHTWASLLIAEGRNVFEVAQQLGHGSEQTLRTYGHVIAAYRGTALDIEAEIRRVRALGGVHSAESVRKVCSRPDAAAAIRGS